MSSGFEFGSNIASKTIGHWICWLSSPFPRISRSSPPSNVSISVSNIGVFRPPVRLEAHTTPNLHGLAVHMPNTPPAKVEIRGVHTYHRVETPLRPPPIVRPRGTRKARIGAVSTRYSLAPSHYRYCPSTLTMSLAERHMRALATSFPDSGPSAQQRKEPPNISSSHTPFLAHGRWRRVDDVFSRITHGSPSNYTHLVWKNGDL